VRYVLKIAYDGTEYCGWQIQKNGATVQQKVEEAFYSAFNQKVNVTASGRTDSGVHAAGQVCHADLDLAIPPERLADALNTYLPQDISVLNSAAAPENFDANRSAKRKTYVYNMYFAPRHNPLKDRYSVWIKGDCEILKMREAAKLFVGKHDFKAYCASGSAVQTTVREIFDVTATAGYYFGGVDVKISVCGGGFLYNMVRTMAGTILYCSFGRITLNDIARSLTDGDRSLVGKTMPPNGLLLKSVDYGIKIFGDEQ
jgi:tRNA pseudouridine38-40 synthase